MKKLVLFAIPLLSLSLFAFAPAENYGVTLQEEGLYHVSLNNSISEEDNEKIISLVKSLYGIQTDGDFTTEMKPGRTTKSFLGRIKILSNFEEYLTWQESREVVQPQQQQIMDVLSTYATPVK